MSAPQVKEAPKPVKGKMIGKNCPDCKQQIPVACKACPCGHFFFNARRTSKLLLTFADREDFIRRTQRVHREKPDYYDILRYDNMLKKAKQRRLSEGEDDDKGSKGKRKKVKKEEDEEEDFYSHVTPDKQQQCTSILEELNKRFMRVSWNPAQLDCV